MRALIHKNSWKIKIGLSTILMLFAFSSLKSSYDIEVRIVADVNRDGKVQFGPDNQGKDKWTAERGAIFFNNNDSDQNTRTPDHADAVINGKEDLKDLAILKVKRIPELPDHTQVTVSVDEASKGKVRLFVKAAKNSYTPVDISKNGNIAQALLDKADLELRIEANSYADGVWNGETQVVITVKTPDEEIRSDSIKLKVAPFILLSNINKGKTLYVRKYPGKNDAFIQKLRQIVPQAGAELHLVPACEPYREYHIWLQDTMEIGYSEKPGQRMNVVLKANRNLSLDNFAKDKLLGPDFGWIQVGKFREKYGKGVRGNSWLDWYGNLEVTPPFPEYPFGRIYYGYNPDGPKEASLNPEIVAMLEAQKIQAPALRLDTGWLLIKHVDEMISFLPSGDPEHPYRILVVDPGAMIALLEKWMKNGNGDTRLLEVYSENTTVASLYKNENLIKHNKYLRTKRIEPNIDFLKRELGLREEDFIRVPALFSKYGASIVPNMVNSAVLNGHILIAAPNGPVIDGKDQLEEEMRKLISGLPVEPHFMDDRQYHKWSGNVHCATNVRREGFKTPWWKKSPLNPYSPY